MLANIKKMFLLKNIYVFHLSVISQYTIWDQLQAHIIITVKELIHPHLTQFTYSNSGTETLDKNLISFSNP